MPPPPHVNKAELAEIISASLPTIDKLLRRYGDDFPILKRGTNGCEYQFDPAAVLAFLSDREAERVRLGRDRDELLSQYKLPGLDDAAISGAKPSDLLTMARVRQIERQEQKEAGFLVETARLRATLTAALTTLTRATDTAIRIACRDANIPEPTIRAIEARVNEAKRRAVAELSTFLAEPEATQDDQPSLLPH